MGEKIKILGLRGKNETKPGKFGRKMSPKMLILGYKNAWFEKIEKNELKIGNLGAERGKKFS